jgi:Na+:H+ antiporter, NhaA family
VSGARRLLSPFEQFVRGEARAGVLLFGAAIAAFLWANSRWADAYFSLQHVIVGITAGSWTLNKSLLHWVNDGLMAVFFLQIGLEIKRELLAGELAGVRKAALAIVAALGGMLGPALLYIALNAGGAGVRGWGIPMATDIAFALGVVTLLGNRISNPVRVLITAIAIVDDLGAVLVIAVAYTPSLDLGAASWAAVALAAAALAGRRRSTRLAFYGLAGIAVWYFLLKSGLHATLAGVLLAFTVPLRRGTGAAIQPFEPPASAPLPLDEAQARLEQAERFSAEAQSPLHRLEHLLHPWVAYLVLPLFAFFNAGVAVSGGGMATPVAAGTFLGLVAGKPIGILFAVWLASRLRLVSLPPGVGWGGLATVGLLAGIGFTMSLFIAGLAFESGANLAPAKIAVLAASLVSAVAAALLAVVRARHNVA